MKPNFELEEKYISLGNHIIVGVDEVGRGALAGPLLVGAVILDLNKSFDGLDEIKDSKKLSSKKREKLSELIKENCVDYSFGLVSVAEIDLMGVGKANILAFARALERLKRFDIALIDGREIKDFEYKHKCIIKGDNVSISIAAASIIAKVERDRKMVELPESDIYQYYNHVGYGTKKHIELIKKHGPSNNHRKSFLRNII